MAILKWTKKLDKMHYFVSNSSTTLCERPLLGNNYAAIFSEREVCEECVAKKKELYLSLKSATESLLAQRGKTQRGKTQ